MTEIAIEYHVGVPTRQLLPIAQAATKAGVNRATLFRWLKAGLLKRYYTPPGIRRQTLVDPAEIKRLQEHPPGHLAD